MTDHRLTRREDYATEAEMREYEEPRYGAKAIKRSITLEFRDLDEVDSLAWYLQGIIFDSSYEFRANHPANSSTAIEAALAARYSNNIMRQLIAIWTEETDTPLPPWMKTLDERLREFPRST